MRLLTFTLKGEARIGVLLEPDKIIDLRRAYGRYLLEVQGNPIGEEIASILIPNDMTSFLNCNGSLDVARKTTDFVADRLCVKDGTAALRERGVLFLKNEIHLKAPVPRPGALICAGKNFSDHVQEMSAIRNRPAYPVAFPKMPDTIVGPQDDIPYPKETEKLDYEVELAIVIGRPCHNVREEDALDYIAGYATFNDISARDVIRQENQCGIFLMGKNFPGFSPMGPYLVLKEEVPDPQNLKLESRVNGEVRQNSNLGYMIFNIAQLVAYWSQLKLRPGDILTTGTPKGVAAGRKEGESPWWLRPGDIVEAEVEGIGCLRNRIVEESGGSIEC